MLAIERRSEILALLESENSVLVADLSKRFDVSEETIRRDLEKLSEDGLAQKTYGGAVLRDSLAAEPSYRLREKTHKTQKQLIAKKVCATIHDNSRIMLDASSTAVMIAKQLRDKKGLTIITNSVEILLEYANNRNVHVISTGGTLREMSLSLVGVNAERMLRDYTVDKAIISCKGVDRTQGVTESNEAEMAIKRAMLRCGREVVLAADASKFDRRSFVRVMDIEAADYIATDALPEEWATLLAEKGVQIL